jgi:hypothetical protein
MTRPNLLALLGLLAATSPSMAEPAPEAAATTEAGACIAVVLPSAQGISGDAGEFSRSLRELLISYLSGPSLRAVPLEARLASQALEEAQQKDCGHVLLTSVARKRDEGSTFGRIFKEAAAPAAAYGLPASGSAGQAAVRGAVIGGAHAVSTMARTSKARDEVTLEYRIGTPVTVMQATPQRGSAKARTDGEDLLTPLVEKAAESIAATVLGR